MYYIYWHEQIYVLILNYKKEGVIEMEKLFDDYKGVILFYIIIAILTMFFVNGMSNKSRAISNYDSESVKVYA